MKTEESREKTLGARTTTERTQPIHGVDSRSIIPGPDKTKAGLKNVCVGLHIGGRTIASD